MTVNGLNCFEPIGLRGGRMGGAEGTMLNVAREQKCDSVGIDAPRQRLDTDRRPLRGGDLEPYRGARLHPSIGFDFCSVGADVDGA